MTETVPYCFICDAPADADPCPRCGHALYEPPPAEPQGQPEPQHPLVSPEPQPAPYRRRWVIVAVAALVVLLLIVLASLQWGMGIVQ